MIPHPRTYTEQLSPEDVSSVHKTALRVLDETGIVIQSVEARELMVAHGASADDASQRVRLSPTQVEAHLAKAPESFALEARNPSRTVEVGGQNLLVSPGYGSPFVTDAAGPRRPATLDDLRQFALLASHFDVIDITGGLIVEPTDVPERLRPLETALALVTHSDKPFLGSVVGAEGARESLRIAEIVYGDLSDRYAVMGLININSPLRLDARMAEALLAYAEAGQPVLLTPGIMMGITAPVTPPGALAQWEAEVIACAVLVQMARPGAPVAIGTGGFGADLRRGTGGFGRPENALGTLLGAQIARHLRVPFRCSGCVTGAMRPDCRSGYERMMTALSAWNAGVHLCLQGAGILDSINSMCYEQFVIDVEVWSYIRRLAETPRVGERSLALDAISSAPREFISHEHTLEHHREELLAPDLESPGTYDAWLSEGGGDVADEASRRLGELRGRVTPPPLDEGVRRELEAYAKARREELR